MTMDYDDPPCIEIDDGTGEMRLLMPLENLAMRSALEPTYGDTKGSPDLFKPSDYKPVNLAAKAPKIYNQGQQGRCNAEGILKAYELSLATSGLPYIHLSRGYLYGSINKQKDQGSMLRDASQHMMKSGTPLASVVRDDDWQWGRWPANVNELAKENRSEEIWLTPTCGHIISALMAGHGVELGITWGSQDKPNAEGVIPEEAKGKLGGHAFCCCGYDPVKKRYLNFQSWGDWGPLHGLFWIPEGRLKREEGRHEWNVIRVPTFSGGVDIPPLV